MTTQRFVVALAVLVGILAVAGGLAFGLDQSSPRDAAASSSSHVFTIVCTFSHRAADDPIVHPGHPGAAHSHDFFPQPGDVFWSPADWAWAGGLFDALLPTWHFGLPVVGYRGRFDAEKAFYLLEKYGVRNTFLFPTALKLMMKAKQKRPVKLRSVKSLSSVGLSIR